MQRSKKYRLDSAKKIKKIQQRSTNWNYQKKKKEVPIEKYKHL